MADGTGLQFTVKVGELSSSTFAVVEFELDEALNAPFTLALKLASPQTGIDFFKVLDQSCELMVWYNGKLQRRVSGIVSEFAQGDTGFRRTRYEATVRPVLWRTGLRTNCRIFQAKKPQEIIEEILKEAGILDYDFSLRQEHAAREYCVQYRESDLDFITRLAAEEGMFFWHEFAAGQHQVVFADHTGALKNKTDPLFFNLANQGLEQGAYIRQFRYAEAVRTTSVELRDYSFKNPAYNQSNKKISNTQPSPLIKTPYEHYDYPGRYKRAESGKAFSGYRLDALRADAVTGNGLSNSADLCPGLVFALTEHPKKSLNIAWQVVSVKHEGKQPQALEEEGGDKPTTFTNTFGVIKGGTAWRAMMPARPMVDGPQIATVTGPATEEIFCDEHGRVKVKFPWDRYGNSDDLSSCWVRVSQGWAGGRYGMVAIPRIGHEVVVSFLEGDPDQPIITGRTYHATNLSPYELPHNKTRTVIRTDTHQGKGYNELSFEDAATREQVFLHAQKDHDTIINNDHRQSVGHDQHLSVVQDKFERIDRHSHRTVGHDDYELIHQDHHQSIGRNFIQSITQSFKRFIGGGEVTRIEGSRQTTLTGSEEAIIGANQRTVVNNDHYLKATNIVLEAGQSFTVKAPGGFLTINDSGVVIQGLKVKINEGGSPGAGIAPVSVEPESPAAPSLPDAPVNPGSLVAGTAPVSPESPDAPSLLELPVRQGYWPAENSPFREDSTSQYNEVRVGPVASNNKAIVNTHTPDAPDRRRENLDKIMSNKKIVLNKSIVNKMIPQRSIPPEYIYTLVRQENDMFLIFPSVNNANPKIPRGKYLFVIPQSNPVSIIVFSLVEVERYAEEQLLKGVELSFSNYGHSSFTYIDSKYKTMFTGFKGKGDEDVSKHFSMLAGPVLLAGTITFYDTDSFSNPNIGKMISWGVDSGHFKPTNIQAEENRLYLISKILPLEKFVPRSEDNH